MNQENSTTGASQILAATHRPVTTNQYGAYIVAGFTVDAGLNGEVRVAHATPEPDLLDPERPSDDEVADARHRMVNAYAKTLERAGYRVERRGQSSRKPYLLASR